MTEVPHRISLKEMKKLIRVVSTKRFGKFDTIDGQPWIDTVPEELQDLALEAASIVYRGKDQMSFAEFKNSPRAIGKSRKAQKHLYSLWVIEHPIKSFQHHVTVAMKNQYAIRYYKYLLRQPEYFIAKEE